METSSLKKAKTSKKFFQILARIMTKTAGLMTGFVIITKQGFKDIRKNMTHRSTYNCCSNRERLNR